MTHLINRLQFEIACPDEEQAFSFRENFGITFQDTISEVVDQVCSQHVNDEQWIQIDKLEIDLGHFSPQSLDINFSEIFKNKFEKELIQKLSGFPALLKKGSRQRSRIEVFQYFLQTGVLPWWADEAQIDLDEISMDILLAEAEGMKQFFYKNSFTAHVWQRVVLQLNAGAKELIILLIDELKEAKELFVTWIQQLNFIINNTQSATPHTINFKPKPSEEITTDIVLKNAPEIFKNIENKSTLLQILEEGISKGNWYNGAQVKQIIQENKSSFLSVSGEDPHTAIKENQPRTNAKINAGTVEKEIIEKYIVKHAGIVLLAPFLNSFFTNLDLLNVVEWKNKDVQYKAVHLLKYLSTGQQKTPEYNLTLEKIICGIAIEEPVPVEILLSEKETHETQLLLESVIEHWKALKNTSVNGLRETFLKRDGLIKKDEQGWLLQVERKTLDILIDSVPWGYSTINLPWNDYSIFVEW